MCFQILLKFPWKKYHAKLPKRNDPPNEVTRWFFDIGSMVENGIAFPNAKKNQRSKEGGR